MAKKELKTREIEALAKKIESELSLERIKNNEKIEAKIKPIAKKRAKEIVSAFKKILSKSEQQLFNDDYHLKHALNEYDILDNILSKDLFKAKGYKPYKEYSFNEIKDQIIINSLDFENVEDLIKKVKASFK